MKIEKYYFTNGEGELVTTENGTDDLCLMGLVYGKPGFDDGDLIQTSTIKEVGETSVTTFSGSVYELGEMNPDYSEMLAVKATGMPVIKDWDLEQRTLLDKIPEKTPKSIEEFTEGLKGAKTYVGLVLSGIDDNGKHICGEVIDQEGNFVTLLLSDPEDIFKLIETKCFVCWREFSKKARRDIEWTGEIAGLDYDNTFDYSFLMKCRPTFQTQS